MVAKNFSVFEIEILSNLINKYRSIIESKKTNAIINARKEESWERITTEFNAFPGVTNRSLMQLRNKYKNMKKDAHRKRREARREILMSGLGDQELTSTSYEEERIAKGDDPDSLQSIYDRAVECKHAIEKIREQEKHVAMPTEMQFIYEDIKVEIDTDNIPEELTTATASDTSQASDTFRAPVTLQTPVTPQAPVALQASVTLQTPVTSQGPVALQASVASPTTVASQAPVSAEPSEQDLPSDTGSILKRRGKRKPNEASVAASEALASGANARRIAVEEESKQLQRIREEEHAAVLHSIKLKDECLKKEHELKMKVLAAKLRFYESKREQT